MPPVLIGGAIAAAGALGAAAISNKGTKQAAQTQAQSNADSNALQRQIYDQNREALQPWQSSGLSANALYNAALGVPGTDPNAARSAFDAFRGSTGYDFRVREGMDALNSGYGGSGLVRSGAALKGLDDYRQGMASAEFGNWLSGIESARNLGFGAASAQAGVGQNFANNSTALNTQNANALGALQMQKAQTTAGAIGGLANIGGYLAGNILTRPQGNVPVSGWGNPGLY